MKIVVRVFLTVAALHRVPSAFAQGTELEPNHPCDLQQVLGMPPLPFTLAGALDALLDEGDVDFYRFQGTPGDGVQVDLEGFDAGAGTLRDPLLGVFDSECQFLRRGNRSDSASSRALSPVPADGVLVLAVSACCDFDFEGQVGVGGSYRLSIDSAAFLGAIRGRVVSADTGEPFGSDFPFPRADLYRCTATECDDWVDDRFPDADGVFVFDTDRSGDSLFAGRYQVRFTAVHHQDAETPPFDVAEDEDRDLGDIPLTGFPRIGAIVGRVVDVFSGVPLPGDDPPFARLDLKRCEGEDCVFEDGGSTDDEGRYSFGEDPFRLLAPGTYEIEAEADEYQRAQTARFIVSEGEHVVVDEIRLTPFPVGFSELRPCGSLPPEGGVCRYSLRVTNRLDEPVEGAAWSIVKSFSTGSLSDETEFQAGAPRRLRLPAAASRVVTFSFGIPETVRNGTFTCAEIYFGRARRQFFFDTVGHRELFCIEKGITGAIRILDEERSRELLRDRESYLRVPVGSSRPRRE
jgi:hypothetical protein